jgi:RNA polymerase sigma factor (sigma-70 family)
VTRQRGDAPSASGRPLPGSEARPQPDRREGGVSKRWPSHTGAAADSLAERFETHRVRLRALAFRLLGSAAEADDAVQEAWLRLTRADAPAIENLAAWLTTVVSRLCLDQLRARARRRELALDGSPARVAPSGRRDPEQEAALADAVGLALLVVIERLAPAERLAFVLHDLFAIPFPEIAAVLGRSPEAARQLASRARRRVRGAPAPLAAPLAAQRRLVETFLGALRAGDVEAVVAVLDPGFSVTADLPAAAGAAPQGARDWALQAMKFRAGVRWTQPALVEGAVGAVVAPMGRLARALRFRFAAGRIAAMEVIADPARLRALALALPPESD